MTQQQKGRIRLDASLFSCAPNAASAVSSFLERCSAVSPACSTAVSPCRSVPSKRQVASASSTSVLMSRRSGRAPYTASQPRSASDAAHSSRISSVIPSAAARETVCASSRRAISAQSSFWSCRKTIVSSTRFRNSGRNVRLSSAVTALFTAAKRASAFSCACGAKPSGVPAAVMLFAPMFDVMMTAVLRKSTLRPCASVTTPSSKICSRIFHTSSCAFSISSKSTTA